MGLSLPLFGLSQPELPDARMEDAFEAFAGSGVGENGAGQLVAIQSSFFVDHLQTEDGPDFGQGRLARLDDSARQVISIDDWYATGAKQLRKGGFAHSNAAGHTQES